MRSCIDSFFAGETSVYVNKANRKEVEEFCNTLEKLGMDLSIKWNEYHTRRQYLTSVQFGQYYFYDQNRLRLLNGSNSLKTKTFVSATEFIAWFKEELASKNNISEEEFISALTGD